MEKHSMRHLLWTALFLLYCSCGCLAAVVQQLPQKGESALQAYTVSTKDENWYPIQITVSAENVDQVIRRCMKRKELSEDDRAIEMKETEEDNKVLCDDENGITWAKRNLLLREILPAAIKLHRDRLMVQRGDGKFVTKKVLMGSFKDKCTDVVVGERFENRGFNDADFVLFVGLAASRQDVKICAEDPIYSNRPISAYITFQPKEIENARKVVRYAAHKIAHGLGLTYGRMLSRHKATNGGIFYGKYDGNRVKVNGRAGVEAKKHYNCPAFDVMYLTQRGPSVSNHWGWHIAKDELMSPYTADSSGMFYTNLTLGAFDDMPYYRANFSMAEPMSWGKQLGCNFVGKDKAEQRDKITRENPNMFCTGEKQGLQCTSDRFALGVCSKKDTPPKAISEEYHYFEKAAGIGRGDLFNDFSVIKPFRETMCEDGNETLMPGSIVDKMSRCLNVKDPQIKDVNGNGVTVQGICAKVKCENGKVLVHYKGNKEHNGKEKWEECTEKGTINLHGSVFSGGTIVCPKYEEVCTKLPETDPPTVEYEEYVEPQKNKEKKEEEEANEQSNSSAGSKPNNDAGTDTRVETSSNNQVESVPAVLGVNGSSQESSTATQSVIQHTEKNSTNTETAVEKGRRASRSRRHIDDATTSQSTSNPNGTEDAIQSQNAVLKGTTLTERQIKEETLKHTNVTVMFGADSSIMVSYMAPLALLVGVVGFVMVP
ncbi:surface protease GP63 [Trypanosoma theileri]|uniref:Leishmanolysin-like peptidase n=1 Tax=Trypanosoma theileri TaxID=67003 RepID=A0A1X0NYN4_9TRYP|nr:surface protease GP63 [Trypanosoma theileri]ORC89329.1 surface protease GP63 [Trypanosoma theileri]